MEENNKQPQNINNNQNTTSNFNVSSEPAPKKKGKGGIIFAIFVILLLLAVTAGLTYYFMYYTKPEQIYKRLISSSMDQYASKLKDTDYKTVKSSIKLGVNAEPNNNSINKSALQIINNTSIEINTQMDVENKRIIADLNSKYNNEDLFNAQMYSNVQDEKTYIYLKDLLNKYIEVDVDENKTSDGEDYYAKLNDMLKIKDSKQSTEKTVKIVKKELLKVVKPEYCSSSKEDVNINNKTVKATKNTLRMTGKQLADETRTVLNNLKHNEAFVMCFEDNDSVRKNIEDTLKNINEGNIDENTTIEVNIYTQGLMNKVVKVSVILITDNQTVTFEITNVEDNKYDFEIKTGDEQKALDGTIYFEEYNDNEGKVVLEFNLEKYGKVAFNVDYSTRYNEPLDNISVRNSVKANELTIADQRTMYTNLQKSKLYEVISQIMGVNLANTNNSLLNMNTTETLNNSQNTQSILETNENNNETNMGMSQNQILTYDDKTKITFGVPEGYKINTTSENFKILDKDTISIRLTSTIAQEDSFYETIKEKADRYKAEEKYENAGVSDVETIEVGDTKFYTAILSYTYVNGEYKHEYKTRYIWTKANDKYILKIEATNADNMTENELKQILTMKIEENK